MSKATLKQLSNETFYDNNNGEITPALHRAFNDTLIDEMVHSDEITDVVRSGNLAVYAKKTDLASYLTTNSASSTYATKSSLSSYLTTTAASSTYATKAALNDYLTTSAAASTYAKKTDLNSYALKTECVTEGAWLNLTITAKTNLSSVSTARVKDYGAFYIFHFRGFTTTSSGTNFSITVSNFNFGMAFGVPAYSSDDAKWLRVNPQGTTMFINSNVIGSNVGETPEFNVLVPKF